MCPFEKNPCRENLYSAKCEQFMCAKNPCFTVEDLLGTAMDMLSFILINISLL